MMASLSRRIGVALFIVFAMCSVAGAQYTLTVGDYFGDAGDTVDVGAVLDSEDVALGFSIGLTHDSDVVTLDDILFGSAISDSNGGDGPDFWVTSTDPDGGPGGTVFCIVNDEGEEEIPEADDQEIAVFQYTISSDAEPSDTSAIAFSSDLGSPPVSTVVSNGISTVPTTVDGSVSVEVDGVEGLTCEYEDPCICDVLISWTVPYDYDEIAVLRDGTEVTTLDGDETSYSFIQVDDENTVTIVGRLNGQDSVAATCDLVCPEVVAADPPEEVVCSVNGQTCEVTLSWTNADEYGSLSIHIDGELEETLDADATTATVTIPDDDEFHDVSIEGTNLCALPFDGVTCEVLCDDSLLGFLRGDVDNSGDVFGLLDAIYLFEWGFINGPAPECEDAADVDDSGDVFPLVDGLYLLEYALLSDVPPPTPGPTNCGTDPTDDLVDCAENPDSCD